MFLRITLVVLLVSYIALSSAQQCSFFDCEQCAEAKGCEWCIGLGVSDCEPVGSPCDDIIRDPTECPGYKPPTTTTTKTTTTTRPTTTTTTTTTVTTTQTKTAPSVPPGVTELTFEYTTPLPGTLTTQTTEYWYSLSPCPIGTMKTLSVEVLLPFATWDYTFGNAALVQVFDSNQGCAIQLCQNNPQVNGICVFSSASSLLLIRISNSVATALTFSLNVVNGALQPVDVPAPSNRSSCPATGVTQLKQAILMDTQATVPTSNVGGNQYQFTTCVAQDAVFTYTALGTSATSAISTFLCDVAPCAPNPSKGLLITADRSGSGLNTFSFPLPAFSVRTYGMLIEGWGDFMANNTYVFSIDVSNVNSTASKVAIPVLP